MKHIRIYACKRGGKMKTNKNWYPTFIKKLVNQEIKLQDMNSENWLKENEQRGNDPSVVKANEKFIEFCGW